MIEQPVARWNVAAMVRLIAANAAVTTAAESVRTLHKAVDHAGNAAADVFALKPTKAGGIGNTVKLAGITEAVGTGRYGVHARDRGADRRRCQRFGHALRCDIFQSLLRMDAITCKQIEAREFQVCIPPGFGCGVTLDDDKQAYCRRDRVG